MLQRNELHFERRSILTAAQLRAIESFPREILRLKYLDYGNGIISGVDFVQRGDEVFTTEGIVKLGNFFYCADEINLSELAKGAIGIFQYHFVLSEPKRTASENVTTEKISLELKKFEENFTGFEFGKFKSGLRINLPKLDAANLFDEFTKRELNLLNVPYSVLGGTTFHPYIFRAVLKKLESKKNPSPADTALMIHLANFGVATIPALKIYVQSNGVQWLDDSRENIFQSILAAIQAEWKIKLSEKFDDGPEKIPTTPENTGIFV